MPNPVHRPSLKPIAHVAWLLTSIAAVVACASASSPRAVPSTPPSIATAFASPTPVPPASGQAQASPSAAPGQTKLAWGVIWDALPAGFPRYPGAEPTDTREGAASASLALPAEPKTASDWWAAALGRLGYRTEATEGPLEDGSLVVHSVGQGSCKIQASFVPVGGSTMETVLFAAACPFR